MATRIWVDGQMCEMQPWQHGLGGWAEVEDAVMSAWFGWMGRGGRCSHGSMVWGGWAEVVDAATAAWFGVDGQRCEMLP